MKQFHLVASAHFLQQKLENAFAIKIAHETSQMLYQIPVFLLVDQFNVNLADLVNETVQSVEIHLIRVDGGLTVAVGLVRILRVVVCRELYFELLF